MPPPTFSGEQTMRSAPDPFEGEHRADDVDDRVERADLVQVHLLDRHLMDRGFGLGQPLKQRLRAVAAAGDSADDRSARRSPAGCDADDGAQGWPRRIMVSVVALIAVTVVVGLSGDGEVVLGARRACRERAALGRRARAR